LAHHNAICSLIIASIVLRVTVAFAQGKADARLKRKLSIGIRPDGKITRRMCHTISTMIGHMALINSLLKETIHSNRKSNMA
jgi:hypothetical protein